MLASLSVRNVVLIESLRFELTSGFNVLTGETGAGKSMLVDALTLVLGGRARPDMVRRGAREAEVEALFEVAPGSRAAAKLEAAGIPCDDGTVPISPERGRGMIDLVIRRVVQSEGRSRAFANGRMCTAAQLVDIAADLCDIASQHESVSLTDPSTHLEYLDAFGKLEGLRHALGEQVDALLVIVEELDAVRAAERTRAEREDFLAFQLREIEELDPRAGEEGELDSERARLKHAGRLGEATRHATDRLYEGEASICDELGRIAAEIDAAAALDGSLAPIARALHGARAEVSDAARALGRYAESVESNPDRLAELDERSFRLQKLLRKHGPTTADLMAHRTEIRAELDALTRGADRVSELSVAWEAKMVLVAASARALSAKRRDAAEKLADAIGRELARLAMGRAKVVVDVTPAPPVAGAPVTVDGARLNRSGIDRVEFLIAPNQGEEPRALRKIASGGELSRALLALKRVLAEKGPAGLYVFDEVDAGVGGAVAEVLGHAIADVARHRQVLCITHLPQVAALADAHFVVDKSESKGRTSATVRRLDDKERVGELARMIGGVKVGQAARRAAEELLLARK